MTMLLRLRSSQGNFQPNIYKLVALMLMTAITSHIGYKKAAKDSITATAYDEDISLRKAARKLGFLTGEQVDSRVRPEGMTHPLEGKQ
jgi:fumarate hydratase class II